MSEKQQTALQQLIEKWNREKGSYIPNSQIFQCFIDDAKAMFPIEKEYLEQFYNQGYTQCSIEDLKPTSRDRYEDAEDYYNKIFKSE